MLTEKFHRCYQVSPEALYQACLKDEDQFSSQYLKCIFFLNYYQKMGTLKPAHGFVGAERKTHKAKNGLCSLSFYKR